MALGKLVERENLRTNRKEPFHSLIDAVMTGPPQGFAFDVRFNTRENLDSKAEIARTPQTGLAWTMIFGLTVATLLTLLVVPAIYAILVETFGLKPIAVEQSAA